MALNGNQVVLPGRGYGLYSDVGVEPPTIAQLTPEVLRAGTDITVTGGVWEQLGHTSRENNVTLAKSGGERTQYGSWQEDVLKESVAPITWQVTVNALQIDNTVLTMYFGGGDTSQPGYYGMPKTSTPQERAFLLVLLDSTAVWPLWFPMASVLGGDGPQFGPTGITEWSLVNTILSHPGTPDLGRIYNDALGTPAGAG
jgi:hypothetical protein